MGTDELRKRLNWQSLSLSRSQVAENDFFLVMSVLFNESNYRIDKQPRDFLHAYEDWPLDEQSRQQIFKPAKKYRHGFMPDYSIENLDTEKKIFVDVKR